MQLGCRELTVGYDGKEILKNINFSVEEYVQGRCLSSFNL